MRESILCDILYPMANHICDACIITCIDFRLQEYINKWIAKNFQPGSFDRVAFAGGVKNLDSILEQIGISERLHNIKKVVLINHEDCGAYGKENIPDEDAEYQRHSQNLKSAAAAVKEKHPDLKVETYYLYLNGTFEKV